MESVIGGLYVKDKRAFTKNTMTYEEFIQNILYVRGRFACGEEYYERHHIVPKCMDGTDEEENLIDLFAKEHYEAHKLLALENPDNKKLQYAWWMMCHCKNDDRQYEVNAEEYEELRITFSKNISGKNHPMYGKHISEEHRKKLKQAITGENNYLYGKHPSEEARKKMSEAAKNRPPISDETRKKMSEVHSGEKHPMFGRHHTEEARKKMSEAKSGENHPNYGKHLPEETKKKMSEAQMGEKNHMYGKHPSEETRKKLSAVHKGKALSEETKRKLSEARKGIACSEEAKQKISETLKGKYMGEESPKAKGVVQYDLDGNLIRIWECIAQATRECNITKTGITSCCKGKQKTAGGFKWRYKNEYEKELNNETTIQND